MKHLTIAIILAATSAGSAFAELIISPIDPQKTTAFDITGSEVTTDGRLLTFTLNVAGIAGSVKPVRIGQLTGAKVHAYVWPTSMDPAKVGFDAESGILAFTITAHPDFDDTPLFDENQDNDPANDGGEWHSHWVVLTPDDACGEGLKVRDVMPGRDLLPATAPNLPIALDSPGMSPIFAGQQVRITVPVANAVGVSFDAVTAELRINEHGEAPLLCVTKVYDVASGDLSLPGKVTTQ